MEFITWVLIGVIQLGIAGAIWMLAYTKGYDAAMKDTLKQLHQNSTTP